MILNRVAVALRRQDWVTVAVEFALVAAGVLFALQVDTWDQNRRERAEERLVLRDLHRDFEEILGEERSRKGARRALAAVELSAWLIDAVRSGEEPADQDRLWNAIRATIFSNPPIGPSPSYQELVSSGRLSLVSSEPLRRALGVYDRAQQNETTVAQIVRENLNRAPVYEHVRITTSSSGEMTAGTWDWAGLRTTEPWLQQREQDLRLRASWAQRVVAEAEAVRDLIERQPERRSED